MELAIPIVALGGMYLVSNQNKKNDACLTDFKNNKIVLNKIAFNF